MKWWKKLQRKIKSKYEKKNNLNLQLSCYLAVFIGDLLVLFELLFVRMYCCRVELLLSEYVLCVAAVEPVLRLAWLFYLWTYWEQSKLYPAKRPL